MQMVFGNMGDDFGDRRLPSRATPPPASKRAVRRVPAQRPGRGRRGRHPHARAARASWGRCCPRPTPSSCRPIEQLEAPLPRHAGHRVHDRARHAVHAADPRRQAHRAGGRADRRELSREGVITSEEALRRIDPGQLDQLLHPMHRPGGRASSASRRGLNASPGAGVGAVVFDADTAERRGRAGESVDPGALGDDARRHPRRARRAGHPDRARRHDQPRGRRGPRHGQAVRRGLRGAAHRPRGPHASSIGGTRAGGRHDHHRRQAPARSTPARCRSCRRRSTRTSSAVLELGRRAPRACGCAPTPTRPEDAARGPGVRRRGHRPLPHRAHVHGEERLPIVREMILADDEERRARALERTPADPAGATSRASSGRWRACR